MLLSILNVNNSSFIGQPRYQGSLLPVLTERESTGRREPENSPFIIGTFEKLAPGLQLGTGGKLVLSKYPHINVRLNFSRLSRIFCELTQVVNFTWPLFFSEREFHLQGPWSRLRVVPHFSSGIVERAKSERA